MFTGIVQAVGEIATIEQRSGDVRIQIRSQAMPWADVQLGDSIATNGVCLTAVSLLNDGFVADVSLETLEFTTIKAWQSGTLVNLEKALMPTSRLGGHIVSGHVDGVGEVVERYQDARSIRFVIKAPAALAKYIAHKGSITMDGASLTVNAVDGDEFQLNIVPHTISETIIQHYKKGTRVNLEVDVIARYLERLLMGDKAALQQADSSALTSGFLAQHGYLK
ncbi:riboflavin synthase [Reinekea thalattae]|uniref:Riboflavin synthase n=1 Tax=Reinekea thalattae TaxID=2593301 RepID=A0A5C8Z957_9GAMM|nr:riboflavin synthase [Reinekea thalattae]TXR54472.1 riboflavin synthase [Reinekea thalattae]